MQGCYEKKENLKIALVCYDGPYLAWCVRVSLSFPFLYSTWERFPFAFGGHFISRKILIRKEERHYYIYPSNT